MTNEIIIYKIKDVELPDKSFVTETVQPIEQSPSFTQYELATGLYLLQGIEYTEYLLVDRDGIGMYVNQEQAYTYIDWRGLLY